MTILRTLAVSALALASVSQAQNLTSALSANSDLTVFAAFVNAYPDIFDNLLSTGNSTSGKRTVLAPSNKAIAAYVKSNTIPSLLSLAEDIIENQFAYHILDGEYDSQTLSAQGGKVAPTVLTNSSYSLLDGQSNVIFANQTTDSNSLTKRMKIVRRHEGDDDDDVPIRLFSGLHNNISVSKADIVFDGGLIHVVDGFLTLPRDCNDTLRNTPQTAELATALTTTHLWTQLESTPRITCLAPTDEAFAAFGTSNVSSDAIKYHVFAGADAFTTDFQDGQSFNTLAGPPVTVSRKDGSWYLNDARIVRGNVVVQNGVIHYLDKVITPAGAATNTTGGSTTSASAAASSTAAASSLSREIGVSLSLVFSLGAVMLGGALAGGFFFL